MASANRRAAKPRFGAGDWIALGMRLLGQEGPDGLTIERLTQMAKKTRGSFYHHFPDHQAFLAALGAQWLKREIDDKIAEIDRLAVGGRRRETLAWHAASIDHAFERELRRLAAKEPVVAAIVARSDEKRIAYLVRLFRSELGLPADEALARARIQHSYFVGAQMVFPDADARFRLKLQKTLGATLWRR